MFRAFTRPRYQVSVYRTIGPLVFILKFEKKDTMVNDPKISIWNNKITRPILSTKRNRKFLRQKPNLYAITVFTIFILGGISSDIRSEILFTVMRQRSCKHNFRTSCISTMYLPK